MRKIEVKKFVTIILLVLLSLSILAGLSKIPLNSIPEVHATGSSSSLIGSLDTIVSAVNYASDIDAVYQGMTVGKTSMQQLINKYNSLTNPMTILQWTPMLSKLGYSNQATIEWALDNQQVMSDGLPYTYLDGSKETFDVHNRYMILAYGYAIQYNYDLAKWNLTKAYNSFKAAVVASKHPALLWINQDGTPYTISYGPRYYDECGETIDCFLDFYNLGINTALNDSLATWLWENNNVWSGTHYNYALNWAGYECEAGSFLQLALKLRHADSSLPNTQNLWSDIENRFLQGQWLSPQWTTTIGGASSYVVTHMASGNPQLRLENTVMAWAAIFGSYGELNSTYQSDVQSMLTGKTSAWLELLQSPLCGSNFPYFSEHSDSGISNDATATGADLLFMLGIVPQTAALAVPIEENYYEDIYNMLDPILFNINLTSNVVTTSLIAAGTLNFQFNQTVISSFSTPGIYTVQFSSDWNTILSTTFASALPSNRQYMHAPTVANHSVTASAGVGGSISPNGSISVNYDGNQTFTITPSAGYHIENITVDDSSVAVTSSSWQMVNFTDVQADHAITTNFAINTFNIAASAGVGGSIGSNGYSSVNYGDNKTFTITPNIGYCIADVRVNGNSVGAVSSYTFTNVQTAYTIEATFVPTPAIYGIAVAVAIVVIVAVAINNKRQEKKLVGEQITKDI